MSKQLNPRITLTGIDKRVPYNWLDEALAEYPELELGLLYTHGPEGRPRYPRASWIEHMVYEFPGRCAVHLCGGRIRAEAQHGTLPEWVAQAARIQANGSYGICEVANLCLRYPNSEIITQHTLHGEDLTTYPNIANHALLVDASGGRGVSPGTWHRPTTTKRVGFAGGLGPDNLAQELPRIANVSTGEYWVDMEGRLRDHNDWFCLERAEKVLNVFREWGEERG